MSVDETCDTCGGRGDLPVTEVRHEISDNGAIGRGFAYRTFVACGRCRGRGVIEVAA